MPSAKKPSHSIRFLVGDCLRLSADLVEAGATADDLLRTLLATLQATKRDLEAHHRRAARKGDRRTVPGTASAQEDLAFEQDQSRLSMKQFGRDITSDTEFPSRVSLLEFARQQGLKISEHHSKIAIRQKLLSHAEIRNMDDLIRRPKR